MGLEDGKSRANQEAEQGLRRGIGKVRILGKCGDGWKLAERESEDRENWKKRGEKINNNEE